MKTGVPGVWEEVARGIKARTETTGGKEAASDQTKRVARQKLVPAEKAVRVQIPAVRRQTSRRME